MELLFVVIIAASIGAIVRYTIPGRLAYGAALLPAMTATVAAVVWVGLLWLGFTFDGGWIWVASLAASAIAAVAVALRLPRVRRDADTALYARLAGAQA
ncbi:MAG: hypothetical protein ACOH1J_02730 [Microbacteriaceae bacterium]